MKEIIFVLVLMGIISVIVIAHSYQINEAITNPTTLIIEGHDYFKVISYGGYFTLTHKGNCKACQLSHMKPEKYD